nr:tyrosine-type recombinase/integrase [Vibrio cyclitrophicus]
MKRRHLALKRTLQSGESRFTVDIVVKNNWAIIHRESKTFRNKGELIFPYNSRSVSAGFQRVRNELGIEDLKYHDLRREGASRLFEKGYSIEEVAQVTGHRNSNILWQVYTQLFPHKLHTKNTVRSI